MQVVQGHPRWSRRPFFLPDGAWMYSDTLESNVKLTLIISHSNRHLFGSVLSELTGPYNILLIDYEYKLWVYFANIQIKYHLNTVTYVILSMIYCIFHILWLYENIYSQVIGIVLAKNSVMTFCMRSDIFSRLIRLKNVRMGYFSDLIRIECPGSLMKVCPDTGPVNNSRSIEEIGWSLTNSD